MISGIFHIWEISLFFMCVYFRRNTRRANNSISREITINLGVWRILIVKSSRLQQCVLFSSYFTLRIHCKKKIILFVLTWRIKEKTKHSLWVREHIGIWILYKKKKTKKVSTTGIKTRPHTHVSKYDHWRIQTVLLCLIPSAVKHRDDAFTANVAAVCKITEQKDHRLKTI